MERSIPRGKYLCACCGGWYKNTPAPRAILRIPHVAVASLGIDEAWWCQWWWWWWWWWRWWRWWW